MLAIAEIGPAESGDFELRLLPAVVARSGTIDGAVGNFVGSHRTRCGERKCGLQQFVRLVPVDVVNDIDLIGAGVKNNLLHEFRILPCGE